MPLVSCPECGAQISDKALSCPSCGHPMAHNAPKKEGSLKQAMSVSWMAIVIAMAIFGLFALLGTCNWRPV